MAEVIDDNKIFSLLEVTKSVEKTLADRYRSSFWVKAEMNKLNFYSYSGHCYPDLVEKRDGKVIAQLRAILWKNDYLRVNKRFLDTLKEPLKDGVKILFLARISFSSLYGLTLIISDIDPSYTLGDLEQEKQKTIKKLQAEGIFHNNHRLKLPLLPQRIAIISVETSKGYADFLRILENNSWNYKFFLLLFPALLQGDKAPLQISKQLQRIKRAKHHFDAVAIIRGGGGDVGLSCYNDYNLAAEIANFPIPIITGIGHATNETVSEMVAYFNAITPTKLAEYLIQKFHDFSVPVKEAERSLVDRARRIVTEEKTRLYSEVKLFRSVTGNILNSDRNKVENMMIALHQQSRFRLKNEKENLKNYGATIRKDSFSLINQFTINVFRFQEKLLTQCELQMKGNRLELDNMERNIDNMDPKNVLKRGYSITLLNGKSVKDLSEVKVGDSLHTLIFDGEINSTVDGTVKTEQQ